jgi:hypothetical protein
MPLHCTISSNRKALLFWQKGRVVTNMRFERVDRLLTYRSRHDTILHRLDRQSVTTDAYWRTDGWYSGRVSGCIMTVNGGVNASGWSSRICRGLRIVEDKLIITSPAQSEREARVAKPRTPALRQDLM